MIGWFCWLIVVFAQEPPSIPMTGVAGWISAGTGIGLLGGVLYWLCWYHIPKILENHSKIMDQKEAQIAQLVKEFRDESKEARVLAREQGSSQRQLFEQTMEKISKDAKESAVSERQECTRRMNELFRTLRGKYPESDHDGT